MSGAEQGAAALVSLRNIVKTFGAIHALKDLSLDLAKTLGDMLAGLLGDGQVAALDVDAHRPTSLRDG